MERALGLRRLRDIDKRHLGTSLRDTTKERQRSNCEASKEVKNGDKSAKIKSRTTQRNGCV